MFINNIFNKLVSILFLSTFIFDSAALAEASIACPSGEPAVFGLTVPTTLPPALDVLQQSGGTLDRPNQFEVYAASPAKNVSLTVCIGDDQSVQLMEVRYVLTLGGMRNKFVFDRSMIEKSLVKGLEDAIFGDASKLDMELSDLENNEQIRIKGNKDYIGVTDFFRPSQETPWMVNAYQGIVGAAFELGNPFKDAGKCENGGFDTVNLTFDQRTMKLEICMGGIHGMTTGYDILNATVTDNHPNAPEAIRGKPLQAPATFKVNHHNWCDAFAVDVEADGVKVSYGAMAAFVMCPDAKDLPVGAPVPGVDFTLPGRNESPFVIYKIVYPDHTDMVKDETIHHFVLKN